MKRVFELHTDNLLAEKRNFQKHIVEYLNTW